MLNRESAVIEETFLRFVKQVASLAQKVTDAALIQLNHPAGNGFAGWKHAILLYLREHMDAEYEEIIDWAEEMDRIRFLLGPRRGKFPAPSTLCKAFKQAPMSCGESCSAGRRSCSTKAVTLRSMSPTSIASKHQLTTASEQDAPYERSRRRFWMTPLMERSSTSTVARSGRVGCESVRRSPCGMRTTFEASLLIKATTA